ncbi:MAG: 1,4-alpha-glucan branching enzyme, partial [Clostridia bacterium]|nr:1,4-alpha-glucan branching enzyme [Clostridia bacterium]
MINKYINKFKNEIENFKTGNSCRAYEFLGVHSFENGYMFCVWAPNADTVSLCGEFNNWDYNANPMENKNGIWYLFCDEISENDIYKYAV